MVEVMTKDFGFFRINEEGRPEGTSRLKIY